MKERYIVSIYVAECNEFRNEGNIYESIYDVSEALEARNSLPIGRTLVIGLRIHKRGEKEAADVLADILIGDVIHLESLEYIPKILKNDTAVNYIAELISLLPDMKIQGSIPDELKTKIKDYTDKHEREEKELREQLFNKLSQLTVEAIKYSKSDNKAEQQYAADLLKYAIAQKEAVCNGRKDIDLNALPLKENYCTQEIVEEKAAQIKETEKSIDADPAVPAVRHTNIYKKSSLLEKLYEYQRLIKQRNI